MNARHRTLIAEDEPLAAEGLADWVRQRPELELVGTRPDGASALQAIRELEPALLLMDIHMPGLSGLQVLRALEAEPPPRPPAVIFTTADDEHAVTAFELHAVDYLLKPFTQARFDEAVRHALQAGALQDRALPALAAATQAEVEPLTRILVRDQGKIFPLRVAAIECLRSDSKYTAIVSEGRHYLVRLPIAAFEKRLDPEHFLKINRSCIVNLDFVVAMAPDDSSQLVLQLRDGTRVTASRDVSRRLKADSL
jgi:two-component system LytT family response regulator